MRPVSTVKQVLGQIPDRLMLCEHSLPIDLKLWIVCQQPHCDGSSVLIQEVAIAQGGPQALTCIFAQPVVKDNWKTQREAGHSTWVKAKRGAGVRRDLIAGSGHVVEVSCSEQEFPSMMCHIATAIGHWQICYGCREPTGLQIKGKHQIVMSAKQTLVVDLLQLQQQGPRAKESWQLPPSH